MQDLRVQTHCAVVVLFGREGPGADFQEVHVIQDRPSGLQALMAIHSTTLGPAFGGIRRWRYASEEDALADALRLAESMSLKCALAGIPAGGAKTVIMDHDALDRQNAYRALGHHVESLGGHYVCGPDVGTTEDDLDEVRAETEYVNPRGNEPGLSTARGVLAGLRATLEVLEGTRDFGAHTFMVQGLGSVGSRVAEALVREGATVLGSDADPERLQEAKGMGVIPVPPEAAISTACDVLVPCALGGVLSASTVPMLRAHAVCGSANNQLADGAVGRLLHERGVLYVPDFVVNAGAVVEGFFTVRDGAKDSVRRRALQHIDKTEATVREILEESRERDRPPAEVAEDMARRMLTGRS